METDDLYTYGLFTEIPTTYDAWMIEYSILNYFHYLSDEYYYA